MSKKSRRHRRPDSKKYSAELAKASGSLIQCGACGTTNHESRYRCLLCDRRMDRPRDLGNRNEVIRYAAKGGYTDIAETLKGRGIRWLPEDKVYCDVLRDCVEFAMEECLASLDILFYREHPEFGNPYLGIRWPESTLIDGVKVFFFDSFSEPMFTVLRRSDTDSRGVNYRFDHSLGNKEFRYEISMYSEIFLSSGAVEIFESPPILLEPVVLDNSKTVYELVRKKTGIKVKQWLA